MQSKFVDMGKNAHHERRRPQALLITDITMPGGVGTHIGQLATISQTLGWDVAILMDDGSGSDDVSNMLQRLNLNVIRTRLYHGYHQEQIIAHSVITASDHVRPDIIHIHCGSPRSAVVPRELVINSLRPLIFTEHFVSSDLEISSATLQRLRQIYSRTFAVVSVCNENRMLLRNRFELYAEKHVVIHCGARLHNQRLPNRRADQYIKAITVARLSPQKGIDTLIRGVALLPTDLLAKFRFTVVGRGEQETQLKRLARRLGVAESIDFSGWSDDVAADLQEHDLFILPSVAEGQPIALLEALANGLPCIASAVSGIPELLGEGRYGALVPSGDPVSLCNAIADFAVNPQILRQKVAAVGPYLEMNHNLENNVREIVSLWTSALELNPIRNYSQHYQVSG